MKLVIDNVGKLYNRHFWGVSNFNLELECGVLGLLGPNGAGKSTLLRILTTIAKPTCGKVLWDDIDINKKPDEIRKVLGYLPQNFGVYPNLNAQEFLEYIAAVKGVARKQARIRIDELLQLVNLHDVRKKPLGSYSGGMVQRIGIAQALLNDPKILIIDEPTTGLDPEERMRMRNLFSELAGERVIIYSTHIVSDIETISSKIAIMAQGKLITCSEPENLLRTVEGKVWEWIIPISDLEQIRKDYVISSINRKGDNVNLRVLSSSPSCRTSKSVQPVLEDVYLYYTALSKGRNV
ncbi:MAG: ABC transporter ATP-binding protein [Bacillota bacterium]|nr:ABC transporter ATP-binding protein [Bacillota bacterium]